MTETLFSKANVSYTVYHANDISLGTIFLLSGCASTQSEIGGYYEKIADVLNHIGINCVTIEVAGNGSRVLEPINSATQDRDDVISVINEYLETTKCDTNHHPLFIMGYSLGALTAAQVIDTMPNNTFSRFIAQAPAWNPKDLDELIEAGGIVPNFNVPINETEFAMYQYDIDALKELQKSMTPEFFDHVYEKIDIGFEQYFERRDHVEPVVVVIGSDDKDVTFNLENKGYWKIDDADHTMNLFDDTKETMIEYFIETICAHIAESHPELDYRLMEYLAKQEEIEQKGWDPTDNI